MIGVEWGGEKRMRREGKENIRKIKNHVNITVICHGASTINKIHPRH